MRSVTFGLMLLGVSASFDPSAAADDAPPTEPGKPAAGTTSLLPREAGARYGQAVGVTEVCHGSKQTDKVKVLATTFTGAELETFNKQAAKIIDSWIKVRDCVNQTDPNICKIIMDRSCLAAESEIGPGGAAMPGLVEFAPHP